MKIQFNLQKAGYCEAQKHHSIRGAQKETIRFYATYGVMHHPTVGVILFDTGYTDRFHEATKSFPNSIYARVTKVFIPKNEEASTSLRNQGIQPEEVKYVIISHFHADHICGLRDFPEARFICSKDAYNAIKGKTGLASVTKGFLPTLMPTDFESRTTFLDFNEATKMDDQLGALIDVFSDASIMMCELDGHAKGQIGIIFESQIGKVFLAADAAWHRESYSELRLPHPIVRLFFASWSEFKRSLKRVHDYHLSNPKTVIVPCHCAETFERVQKLLDQ